MGKSYLKNETVRPSWHVKYEALLAKAVELSKRPSGVSIADLVSCGTGVTLATRTLNVLTIIGTVRKVKMGHKTVRYIHTSVPPEQAPQEVVHVPAAQKLDPSAPAIITPQTKITVCPSPSNGQFHKSQFSNW